MYSPIYRNKNLRRLSNQVLVAQLVLRGDRRDLLGFAQRMQIFDFRFRKNGKRLGLIF